MSYLAKLALIGTIIAIIVIVLDALAQILMYLDVRYFERPGSAGMSEHELQISYMGNDNLKNIHWWMPFYPYFMDCFCKIQVSFCGAPIISKLYTSSENKHFFVRNLNRAVIWIGVIQLCLGLVCVIAYGNKLQEIVLMCLHYGIFMNFIKLLYAGGIVVNLVMQLVPVIEVVETRQPAIYGYGTSPNENKDKSVHVYLYDPTNRTWLQALVKFGNTSFFVVTLLLLTLFFDHFHLLLLIDAAGLTNILILLIPNALYIHQCNYGYLKFQERRSSYLFAIFMFYLSILIMIYAAFRGI